MVLCSSDDAILTAARSAILNSGFYELVGEASSLAELAGVLQGEYPDVVVVDDAVLGSNVAGAMHYAGAGRPVPALVLVASEAAEAETPGRLGETATALGRDVLLSEDAVSQNHVWTRLMDLAESVTGERKTQTGRALLEAIERERRRAEYANVRPEVVTLATWPADLILLVGGRGNEPLIREAIEYVTTPSVPILVALRPEGALSASVWSQARADVTHISSSMALRRAQGILVAPIAGQVIVTADELSYRPSRSGLALVPLITSMASLQSRALTVLLGDHDTDLATALSSIVRAGGITAAIDPTTAPAPRGPTAARQWGSARFSLRVNELVWLLNHAVPRRV